MEDHEDIISKCGMTIEPSAESMESYDNCKSLYICRRN